tara:strand:- start:1832 stop:3199 length:1368 start_codon:yes stop_codon:yes gene_type:complete
MELTYKIDGSATPKTISFTQQQNQTGQAVFNLSEIYKSIVTPQITPALDSDAPTTTTASQKGNIHTLPNMSGGVQKAYSIGLLTDANGYEAFRGVANVMTIKFYEFYSTTATGIPEKQTSGTGTDARTIFMFWGRGQEDEGVIVDFEKYKLDGDTKQLLSSNYQYRTDGTKGTRFTTEISVDEYHTIAFLNRNAINVNAEPYRIHVYFYNSSGSQIGDLRMNNTTTSGGQYSATAASNTNESFYLYAGVGLANLSKIDVTQAAYGGDVPVAGFIGTDEISYYAVYIETSASVKKSERYDFKIITYCPKYDQSRLTYMNRFGAWEYITLNKERTDELKIKRETITKPIINQATGLTSYSTAQINAAYPLDVAKQGIMNTSISPKITTKMFTDNLTEDKIEQIKDLMMSPQIHLLDGDNAKALILENSSMKLKREKNLGLYKYELNFSFANPKYRTT